MSIKTLDIFGVNFAAVDYEQATELIVNKAIAKRHFSVFALPVHGVVEARRDAVFKAAVDSADLIVPDGQPIRWAMNYFHKANLKDRVYGPELTSYVLRQANIHRMRVFLYGGSTTAVLNGFKTHIEANYPNVIVCGTYREETFGEESIDLEAVKELGPNLILVGLGCPSQEKWIAKNNIEAAMMGVGAAFSFYSGKSIMAPKWMQNNGLEWLYRLVTEPRRLWKRYLVTNTHFLVLVSCLWFSKFIGK